MANLPFPVSDFCLHGDAIRACLTAGMIVTVTVSETGYILDMVAAHMSVGDAYRFANGLNEDVDLGGMGSFSILFPGETDWQTVPVSKVQDMSRRDFRDLCRS